MNGSIPRYSSPLARQLRLTLGALIFLSVMLVACAEEEEFPNDIPAVKATVGMLRQAVDTRTPADLDSICTDRELYGDLVNILGDDSLAVHGWRIQNPIDSAHVIMTVGPASSADTLSGPQYRLELYMRKQGETYWIVAHRLRTSPQ